MNQTVVIDKSNSKDVLDQSKYLKEEIKLSIISMVMDIGYFNVNISVKKDEDKRKDILIRRALNNQRIKEISDNRNNILVNYNMYHYMW